MTGASVALRAGIAALALAGGLCAAPAAADTLREALALAYQTNPTLEAARAQQRATDESVPINRADGLPSVSADASYLEFLKSSSSSFTTPERSVDAGLSLNVPLYTGGAVKNSVRAAETRVEAGRADLRGTESFLFTQVVSAYMDVIQNEAIVALTTNNVNVLQTNLEATSDRFEIGDLTRTDVAQSEARLALARSDRRSAQSNLIEARERYTRLVGEPPVDLAPPPPLPGLPTGPQEAVAIALEYNPDILAAERRAEAAGYDTDVVRASRLPRVSAFADGGYTNYLGTIGDSAANPTVVIPQGQSTATVGVRATIPIFQGGRPAALVRQSQARQQAALETMIATEREVIATVRAAYASFEAANAIIASNQSAVDAATLSLEGVRAENTVGNRTILDILNAEQELLRARVQLVTARRNAYVAGFTLLATMGRAEARDLMLEGTGPLYDPIDNYERVRGKIWDWDDDPTPEIRSTSTVDTPAQTGEIQGPVLGIE